MPSVSIILPANNEEEGIGVVLASLASLHLDAEIIVVDDGSTDRTGQIAQAAGSEVIRHPLAAGAGRSVKDGIERAASERIVMLDADGTYPVDAVPQLLAELDRGFDLVIGARRGREYRGSLLKTVARFFFKAIAQFATGKRIPDINSGMRAFRRSRVLPYFPHLCNGFSLPTTMTLSFLFTGRSVAYVPIAYGKRLGRSKVRFVRDTLRTLQYITESIATFNPVKLFLLLALLCVLIGVVALPFVGLPIFFLSLLAAVIVFSLGLFVHGARRRNI